MKLSTLSTQPVDPPLKLAYKLCTGYMVLSLPESLDDVVQKIDRLGTLLTLIVLTVKVLKRDNQPEIFSFEDDFKTCL